MLKNKSTIFGALLIALLFLWATHNSEKQTRSMQEEMKKAQAIEKAKLDSLKAIPGVQPAGGRPELVAAPAQSAVADTATAQVTESQVLPRQIVVETDRFYVTLDNRGAKIRSVVPKALASLAGVYPEIIQDQEAGALSLRLDQVDYDTQLFVSDSTLPDTVRVQNPWELRFTFLGPQGQVVVREYRFSKEGDEIGHVTRFSGMSPQLWTIQWKGGMRETDPYPEGKALMGAQSYFFSEVILNNSYNVERHTLEKKTWFNKEEGKAHWVGLRRKYIAAVINWGSESEASIGADPIPSKEGHPATYALTVSDRPVSDSIAFDFVVLPLVHSHIEAKGQSYEKIMFSGWEWLGADKWFVGLCGYILKLLNFFYSLIPNYGVAIILLTLVMKFITMPLTLKQLRSTREMQMHKPAMDEIRLRNRANPQKMQKELMEYYAKHGINPFAAMFGCFTMFLQMPVFIGLFVVLGRAIELRYAPFIAWIQDLSAPDVIYQGLQIPYLFPEGLTILPFVMMVTTYIQTKQTITDPQQKMMVYMMPVMMLVFSTVMPSGLIVYWIVSNLFSIIQYWYMNRGGLKTVAVEVVDTKKHKRKH